MPQQAQQHFQRQGDHDQQEGLGDRELQQAHAVEIFWHVAAEQRVDEKAASREVSAHYDQTEYAFAQVRGDAEDVRQVAVHLVNQSIVIPGLSWPEPLPAGSSNESADNDHRDPKDDETEQERGDREAALLPGVIAAAFRVGVDVGNHHQAYDDERRHDHAGDPWVEVDQHFLEAEEIPGRL